MRNMMLIGKMNDVLADLNKFLSGYFRVQIASESGDGLQALIKLSQPDIIVISLIGFYDVNEVLFATIKKDFEDIPV